MKETLKKIGKQTINGLLISVIIVMFCVTYASFMSLKTIKELQKKDLSIQLSVENGMVLNMEATGYAIGAPYSSLTKSGECIVGKGFLKVGDLDVFTVAVDPKVLKLGSVVYMDSLGLGMVTDTGSKINGLKIDICFKTIQEARNFGKKTVKVFILKN
jgi:3D (Asp-Asp-Asp) domain-containing protein